MFRKQKNRVLFLFVILGAFFAQGQSELSKSKYAEIITSFINGSDKTSKFSRIDLEDIFVNSEVFSKKTGIAHVYLNQRYNGVKLYNAITAVGIKDDKVFHYADKFQKNIKSRIHTTVPVLTANEAIEKAATYFKLGAVGQVQFIENKKGKNVYSKGSISKENIPLELVYVEKEDGTLVLSWNLSIYTLDASHWWSVRVDAVTGEILSYNDWVISCNFGDHLNHLATYKVEVRKEDSFNLFKPNRVFTPSDGSQYNVFALPVESPSHGGRSIVTEPANAIASPYGWHDTNGVVGPEFTITRGNNVFALDDVNADDGIDGFSPEGTSSLNFNYPLNLDQNPSGYLDVSTTNLFYLSNMMHDIWYQYGFDEASGNFQENNYGKGGLQADAVVAQSQDGGGLNNANFATPEDGSAPRMQMFLWGSSLIENLLTINNGSLAGGYSGYTASFGADLVNPITEDLVVIIDDNSGASTDPNDACDVVTNSAALAGKIAVIRRGLCEFGVKMLAAENAGAIAAIVITDDRPAGPLGPGAVGDQVTIPSIMIDKATGDALIASLQNGDTINVSLQNSSYQIDGSFDNGIIAHEYGHGISTRLTGGADNSDCLNTNLQMGEGWSDWFGLMLTMKASDFGATGRGIATFSVNESTNGLGIRLRRYSTDFSINEFTFEATNDNTQIGTDPDTGEPIFRNRGVHYIGTIWATMLWDLTWAYIDKYGFDPDLFNGTGGNNKVMEVVIEGLKLQGCNPEFLQGRDGILAADIALTGGENQCLIWNVFATRGLGVNASNGFPFRLEDQIANFETPDPSDASLANCTTLSAKSFNQKDYRIFPNPTSNKLIIKTNKNLGDVTFRLFDINGREVLSKKEALLGEVELNVSSLQSGLYLLKIKGDYIDTNEKVIIK